MMPTASVGTTITMLTDVDEESTGTYSTPAMIRDVEEVTAYIASLVLGQEDAPVAAVSLEHHFPVEVGSPVELQATVTEASSHKMVTDVVVMAEGRAAASATLTQLIPEDAAES